MYLAPAGRHVYSTLPRRLLIRVLRSIRPIRDSDDKLSSRFQSCESFNPGHPDSDNIIRLIRLIGRIRDSDKEHLSPLWG